MFPFDIKEGFRHFFFHPNMREFSYFTMVEGSSVEWHSPLDGAGLNCVLQRSWGTS